MSTLALASQIFGLYTGFVYFTPVFGGWIADRFIGRRNAVMLGAVLMSARPYRDGVRRIVPAGAVPADHRLRLAQGQYLHAGRRALCRGRCRRAHARLLDLLDGASMSARSRGRSLCGLLAQLYGWHAGFGAAGAADAARRSRPISPAIAMLPKPHAARRRANPPRRSPRSRGAPSRALFAVMAITIFHSIAYYQNTNIGLVWINEHVDLDVLGFHVAAGLVRFPIDSFVSIICVPLAVRAVALAGAARRRAGRDRQDRHRRRAGRCRQSRAGRLGACCLAASRRSVRCSMTSCWASRSLLLADAAGAGLAHRAAAAEIDPDGRRVPHAVPLNMTIGRIGGSTST